MLFRGVTLPPDPGCIVTEYCHGGSLHTWLKNNRGKVNENQVISIACDIAKGMVMFMYFFSAHLQIHLHEGIEEVEIIHRDLAARNILVLLSHLLSDLTD